MRSSKEREVHKPKFRKLAFSLIGIFIGGIVLRIAFFFFGVQLPPFYSHLINYSIIGTILSYMVLQAFYRKIKHKWV